MSKPFSSTRRGFLQFATATGVALRAAAPLGNQLRAQSPRPAISAVNLNGINPFKDPSFAEGAKQRLQEFIGRGADPEAAGAIFAKLTSLDAEPWVAEWTKLAEPFERQAAELEAQGKVRDATKAYQKAAMYYGIAKFPVINHPAKQAAYQKAIVNYRKAARSQDPPMELVEIPFEGKKIIGYLRKPKGVTNPPVVIAAGGVDVYKEERGTNDILGIGAASFSMDMPGAGECPVFNTPTAERVFVATMDYLNTRDDLDGKRMGFIGRSYGGYWGGKMAYVEPKRLKACVQWGGPIHYTFEQPWLNGLLEEKEYFWSILDSMIYSNGLKDYDELLKTGDAMSLKTQGLLDKPSAPMIMSNGDKDPWISPEEIPLLLSTGDPKTARIIAGGKHMGRGAMGNRRAQEGVMEWVKYHLNA